MALSISASGSSLITSAIASTTLVSAVVRSASSIPSSFTFSTADASTESLTSATTS
jgi:hypothetical protein